MLLKQTIALTIFFISTITFADGPNSKNWISVKSEVLEKIYFDHKFTFYCGCPFKDRVLIQGCYKPQQAYSLRIESVEIEHIVPAADFGRSFLEWDSDPDECRNEDGSQMPNRPCLLKINPKYREMYNDLHNLVPEIGELNALRRDYRLDMVGGPAGQFGHCSVKIGYRSFEPPDNVKGDVARIYLYMDKKYPHRGIVGDRTRRLFQAWDKLDPVDKWECIRDQRIFNLQGDHNSFVFARCP